MPKVDGRTLVIAIQAVEAEMRRIRALPEKDVVPGDEVLLHDYENAAEELEDAYMEACETTINLPPYSQLVNRPD